MQVLIYRTNKLTYKPNVTEPHRAALLSSGRARSLLQSEIGQRDDNTKSTNRAFFKIQSNSYFVYVFRENSQLIPTNNIINYTIYMCNN